MESCKRKKKKKKHAHTYVSVDRECASTICCLLNRRGRRTSNPCTKNPLVKGGEEVRPVTHELYRTSGQMSPPRTSSSSPSSSLDCEAVPSSKETFLPDLRVPPLPEGSRHRPTEGSRATVKKKVGELDYSLWCLHVPVSPGENDLSRRCISADTRPFEGKKMFCSRTEGKRGSRLRVSPLRSGKNYLPTN